MKTRRDLLYLKAFEELVDDLRAKHAHPGAEPYFVGCSSALSGWTLFAKVSDPKCQLYIKPWATDLALQARMNSHEM